MSTPTIRFARTQDGVSIAFSSVGGGPPLLVCDGPFQPLRTAWQHGVAQRLTESFRVVRLDHRRTGASERGTLPEEIGAQVLDLEAVVSEAALDQFALCGYSHGAHAAISFAALHPNRVTQLIIYGSPGPHQTPRSEQQRAYDDAFDRLLEQALERDNLFARRAFALALMPTASLPEIDEFAAAFVEHITADVMLAYNAASRASTVELLAPTVSAPTLVMHIAGDPLEEVAGGQGIAALIPGAQFLTLEGADHLLRVGQPEAATFIARVLDFVGAPSQPSAVSRSPTDSSGERGDTASPDDLTPRERQVLNLLARGDSNQEIARTLDLSVRTVERHVGNLYEKINARGRADAIAYAFQHGLAGTPDSNPRHLGGLRQRTGWQHGGASAAAPTDCAVPATGPGVSAPGVNIGDSNMTDKAEPSVLIDNDKVAVADWRMGPDTQIGDHVHASDYLVVPLSPGELTIATADGDLVFPLEVGTAFFGAEGDAHDVLNHGNAEIRFLEIHIK